MIPGKHIFLWRHAPLCALLLAAAPLNADPTLDGWRGYRFGMTQAQVRRLGTPAQISEYGHSAHLDLDFNTQGKLATIGLRFDGDVPRVYSNLTPAQCETKYADILRNAEAQYGAFGPRPGSKAPAPHTVTSTRTPANGKSRYGYSAYTPHAFGGAFMADAARYYGERFIVAQMMDMDLGASGSACELSLAFVSPLALQ